MLAAYWARSRKGAAERQERASKGCGNAIIVAADLEVARGTRRRHMPFAEVQQRGAMQGWRCKMCGELFAGPYQIDHLIPFCLVGEETPVYAICGTCHDYKSRVEGRMIQRVRDTLERSEHPRAEGVCFLCGQCVSPHFSDAHACAIDPERPYAHVLPEQHVRLRKMGGAGPSR